LRCGCVAEDDIADILPLDQHVGFAYREGFRVQLLPVHGQARLRVHGGQVLVGDREHSAGARRRVVDRAYNPRLGERLTVLDEDEVDHKADDLARREVLARRLVRQFREAPDEFLEHESHLGVVDLVRVEIDLGEPLGDEVEQLVFGQPVDLGEEIEPLENIADRGREALNVCVEILGNVVLITHELAHIERGHIGEALPRLAQDERLRVQPGLLLLDVFGEHRSLGRLQDAVQAAQHGERQDDLAVVGLLIVTAEEIGDRPDEGG
jgi:hypothetical protein